METVIWKINDLKEAEYNPRRISQKQEEELRASLKKFGIVKPIVVNTHPSRRGVIVGGHQTTKQWREMGNTTIPCIEVNLTKEQEKELNVRLNKNGGEFDITMLRDNFEVGELREIGFEAYEIGMDDFTIISDPINHDTSIEVPEPPKEKRKRDNWFKASEQLPEEEGVYLVWCVSSFTKNYNGVIAEYYTDNKTFYDDDTPINDLTHWQHLPEAPKD